LRCAISGTDIGLLPVWDVALLPSGQIALATGEAGLRILSRAGRTVAHLETPAHRLVVSDRGDRAIAMARRGDAWRLSRIDLVRRRADDWCDARIDAATSDYDGAIWFVATTDLFAIDATAARLESLWQTRGICAPDTTAATRLSRSSSRLLAYVSEGHAQVWSYELPSLTLRSREDVPGQADRSAASRRFVGISTEGVVADIDRVSSVEAGASRSSSPVARKSVVLRLISEGSVLSAVVGDENEDPGEPALTKDWVATCLRHPDGCRVLLLDTMSLGIQAELQLARAQRVALRLGTDSLCIADDRGRVLVVELAHRRLIRDYRT
jgi:hypothetical protein